MKIINGLVFYERAFSNGKVDVRLVCKSEGGKDVGQLWRGEIKNGRTKESLVAEGVEHLTQWFEQHTRPNPENLRAGASLTHPDRFKRPYKPAGYLRRFSEQELAVKGVNMVMDTVADALGIDPKAST